MAGWSRKGLGKVERALGRGADVAQRGDGFGGLFGMPLGAFGASRWDGGRAGLGRLLAALATLLGAEGAGRAGAEGAPGRGGAPV
ncbi:hypothetical protein [Kitasatospora sp. GP82]|uniref:hypothetical protein n=1 Tax=Kitasatospora sp. GP82 TaxID=3035089 RepID=UPI00247319D5|nr:hypothetical protein [Kitasatospora sp. GP82]